MKIIILNSGMGTRLGNLTKNNPKSLVKINNDTIFSRAVKILSNYSDEFIITTGYLNDVLNDYISNNFNDLKFTYVHNPIYDKTNYIQSIDYIPEINDAVLLLHGDLVFSENVAEMIIATKKTSVIVDSTMPLPKDDFKAKIENNHVKCISTNYFSDDAISCQPFYKLTEKDWKLWRNKIHEYCINGKTNVYAENALNELTNQIIINPIDIKGDLCMEIDTKKDLEKARRILK